MSSLASALYLAGPLAVLGTVPDGLIDYPLALITKATMDGLAMGQRNRIFSANRIGGGETNLGELSAA